MHNEAERALARPTRVEANVVYTFSASYNPDWDPSDIYDSLAQLQVNEQP